MATKPPKKPVSKKSAPKKPKPTQKPASKPEKPVDPAVEEKPSKSKKIGKDCAANLQDLADAIGCDRETIRRHMKMPGNPGRKPNHSYDIPAWKAWFDEHGSIRIDSPEKKDLECQRLEEIVRRMRTENAEREGQIVDIDEAITVFGGILKELQMELRQSKHRLAPEVVGLSVGEANSRIGKEIESALTKASIPSYLKKKPFWQNVSVALSDLLKN